ncbi:TAXI family TRAP transporter solute-binding subunit [Elioraea rosea]|uniref:TAXI family TRAP transporter solute-binding subunit n=1 Tax=Elioraea rosea TaxID=2492390 RepID=UPI001315101D|nr:TAXI family TRAP transporter solute-binding subunit [Elioraea rosea]
MGFGSIMRRGLLAGAVGVLGLTGAASAQTYEMVAGALGGGWYTMATGLSAMIQENNPGLTIRVVPGGGLGNPTRVQNGVSQIGFGLDFLVSTAVKGGEPYRAPHDKIAHIGVGYSPTEHHFIRRGDGGPTDMKSILTMQGLRLGAPQSTSSDTLTLIYILRHLGTSFDKIRGDGGRVVQGSYSDIAAAFIDGQVDYVYVALARPAAMVNEIQRSRREGALVAFPQDVRDHLSQTYGFSQGTIPQGTYPAPMQTAEIPVTTMDTVLVVPTTLPDEAVYRMVRTFIQNKDRLGAIHPSMAAFNPAVACKYPGAPIHPGAKRAFAEAGCTM